MSKTPIFNTRRFDHIYISNIKIYKIVNLAPGAGGNGGGRSDK